MPPNAKAKAKGKAKGKARARPKATATPRLPAALRAALPSTLPPSVRQFQMAARPVLQKTLVLCSTDIDYCHPGREVVIEFTKTVRTAVTAGVSQRRSVDRTVDVVVLADAKKGADSWEKGDTLLQGTGRLLIAGTKAVLENVVKQVNVVAFAFGDGYAAAELARARAYVSKPGNVVIVLGGNTFNLMSAVNKVPSFRDVLISNVKAGKLLYIGYSAGSMIAGTDIGHAQDERPSGGMGSTKGLCLIDDKVNPHAQAAAKKDRPGVKIRDGQALFVTRPPNSGKDKCVVVPKL